MNQELPPAPSTFVDRSTSLAVFGVLTILTGLLIGLFVPLMIAGQRLAVQHEGVAQNPGALIPAELFYGGLAVALVWLGVGSIMARRWARALLLILAWSMLIFGVCIIAGMAAMWPTLYHGIEASHPANAATQPESIKWVVMGGSFLVIALLVVLPSGIGAFFYSRKSVKATCEARTPAVCWTDRAPLPVIAASLFLAFGAVSMLGTAFSVHGVAPFFGLFVTGLPGFLLYGILALLWVYAAVGIYRLDSRAWWLGLLSMCIFPLSASITYHLHGVMQFYKLAGYTEAQLAQLQKISFFSGENMVWVTFACSLPWIIYLLFVKRYFRRAQTEA